MSRKKPKPYWEPPREDPYCNYDREHVRSDLYAKQLRDRDIRINQLETELAATQAELGRRTRTLTDESDDLLIQVAQMLLTIEMFADPSISSPTSDTRASGRPTSKEPKGGHPGARATLGMFRGRIRQALEVAESRQRNDWQSPRYKLYTAECVWCGNEFTAERSDAKYDSDACRKAHRRNKSDINRTADELQERTERAENPNRTRGCESQTTRV